MEVNPQPRERAQTPRATRNTIATSKTDINDLLPLIPSLGGKTIIELLTYAARAHPDVHTALERAITEKRQEEYRRVETFSYESGHSWKQINVTYSSMSGSKQYNFAGDVYRETVETIERIAKQCGPFANPRTRYNGL
ncbi:hypothetical protein BJX70DRAFT_398530 [Aspergillus crustosus]